MTSQHYPLGTHENYNIIMEKGRGGGKGEPTVPLSEPDKIDVSVPWVEKYRPTQFDNIVLDPTNREIFNNILQKKYFPNLLFYGPPGTGKTTTIINLINEYQTKHTKPNKSNIIHLNASDERGIDIIRNQILSFVKSMNLFETGLKFVVLDEVDYMTKNAQQALKYLLQTSSNNVRFCLICNYISKIDESLRNEFICIRFNQLPKTDIYHFIKTISLKEKIKISDDAIQTIQTMFHSDIRSMINFLQLNQNLELDEWNKNIISPSLLEKMYSMLTTPIADPKVEVKQFMTYMQNLSIQYNIDKKHIILSFYNYVIRNHSDKITPEFLSIVEKTIHSRDAGIDYIIQYFFLHMIRSGNLRFPEPFP
jgi:replication factor C subunit 3/5